MLTSPNSTPFELLIPSARKDFTDDQPLLPSPTASPYQQVSGLSLSKGDEV